MDMHERMQVYVHNVRVACTFMNVDSLEMSTLHSAVSDTSHSEDVSESARSMSIFLVLYPPSDLPPPLPHPLPRPRPQPDIVEGLLLEKRRENKKFSVKFARAGAN